jgi:hypothetical protein
MRMQIAVLLLVVAASGTAEALVSTLDERDESYWKSSPQVIDRATRAEAR